MPPEIRLNVLSLLSFFRALPFFRFQQNSQKKMGMTKAEKSVPRVRCCKFSLSGHDTSVLSYYHTPLCTLNLWLILTQNHSFLHTFAASDLWHVQNTHPTSLSSPIVFSLNPGFLTFPNRVLCSYWCSKLFSICHLHQSLTSPVSSTTFYPLSRLCDQHYHTTKTETTAAERTGFSAQYSKTFRC